MLLHPKHDLVIHHIFLDACCLDIYICMLIHPRFVDLYIWHELGIHIYKISSTMFGQIHILQLQHKRMCMIHCPRFDQQRI